MNTQNDPFRVLLVDDEEADLRAGKEILERASMEVVTAGPDDAWNRYCSANIQSTRESSQQGFHVVISDFQMGSTTGVALAIQILNQDATQPIVLMSSDMYSLSSAITVNPNLRERAILFIKPLTMEKANMIRERALAGLKPKKNTIHIPTVNQVESYGRQ